MRIRNALLVGFAFLGLGLAQEFVTIGVLK